MKGSFVAVNSTVLPVPIMVYFIVEHSFKSNSSIQIGNIELAKSAIQIPKLRLSAY